MPLSFFVSFFLKTYFFLTVNYQRGPRAMLIFIFLLLSKRQPQFVGFSSVVGCNGIVDQLTSPALKSTFLCLLFMRFFPLLPWVL